MLVGFGQFLFDNEDFKAKYNVPENFKLVSTLTLGYMEERPKKGTRKKQSYLMTNKKGL